MIRIRPSTKAKAVVPLHSGLFSRCRLARSVSFSRVSNLLDINSEKYMFILMLQDTVIYRELVYKYLSIEVNHYIEGERERERTFVSVE